VGLVPKGETWSALGLGRDERIVHLDVPEAASYLVLGAARGRLWRTSLSVLIAELLDGAWEQVIGLTKNDEVVFGGTCGEEGQVLLFTGSRALRTTVEEISDKKTFCARGAAGIRLDRRDSAVDGAVIEEQRRREALILSGTGYLNRLPVGKFALQGRGGKGMQSLRITKATGPVIPATAGRASRTTEVDLLAHDGKRQPRLWPSSSRCPILRVSSRSLSTLCSTDRAVASL
jgi:DNA gyrase subunit A